jgi:N-acetylglucosamine-6-phosphate deacetylase
VIALTGARLIVSDRVLEGGTLVIDDGRIAEIRPSRITAGESIDRSGHFLAPGFIDVHVHGVAGLDALDEGWPIDAIARRLPRHGVTAFCPTTVACPPRELAGILASVQQARSQPPTGARVLRAHLESNFISPQFCGAQPLACLRLPPLLGEAGRLAERTSLSADYDGEDVLRVIDGARESTGIVTLAPELPASIDLIRWLRARNVHVSVGHSGATYDQARAAFDAGARQATHLFNRMAPFHHRAPGIVGAVLDHENVDAEVILDGYHVDPGAARLAIRLKGLDHVLAITDGTGGSGMPVGSAARLGGRQIVVGESAAFLDDGTLAGSTQTMDGAFRLAVERLGCTLWEAARLCSTNPARALVLADQGRLQEGAAADFTILDRDLRVVETWIAGRRVWSRLDGEPQISA